VGHRQGLAAGHAHQLEVLVRRAVHQRGKGALEGRHPVAQGADVLPPFGRQVVQLLGVLLLVRPDGDGALVERGVGGGHGRGGGRGRFVLRRGRSGQGQDEGQGGGGTAGESGHGQSPVG